MNKVVKYHNKENMLIQIFFPYNRLQNTSEFETPYNFSEISRLLAFFTIHSLSIS